MLFPLLQGKNGSHVVAGVYSVIPAINSLDYELLGDGVGECWGKVSPRHLSQVSFRKYGPGTLCLRLNDTGIDRSQPFKAVSDKRNSNEQRRIARPRTIGHNEKAAVKIVAAFCLCALGSLFPFIPCRFV